MLSLLLLLLLLTVSEPATYIVRNFPVIQIKPTEPNSPNVVHLLTGSAHLHTGQGVLGLAGLTAHEDVGGEPFFLVSEIELQVGAEWLSPLEVASFEALAEHGDSAVLVA